MGLKLNRLSFSYLLNWIIMLLNTPYIRYNEKPFPVLKKNFIRKMKIEVFTNFSRNATFDQH